MDKYDKIILGAGIYGLYSAFYCTQRGERVLVLDCDNGSFRRATYVNQARIHSGYHYPRSASTAIKSIEYFDRFNNEFGFCLHKDFEQIYAISNKCSWTNASQFEKFCRNVGIKCEEVPCGKYFRDNACEAAYLTEEYTYDAQVLRDYLVDKIKGGNNRIEYGVAVSGIQKSSTDWMVLTDRGDFVSKFILNSTYASVNQIIGLLDKENKEFDKYDLKYEKCEIILCDVSKNLKDVGVTVMDGPFFSIMPFGMKNIHSLTSVTFTPHETCRGVLPNFECMDQSGGKCSSLHLLNCNECDFKPCSSWKYMHSLAKKFLKPEIEIEYRASLFSIKPVLTTSEIDDSRPTSVVIHSTNPWFVSVLSGKVNTVFDMDKYLLV